MELPRWVRRKETQPVGHVTDDSSRFPTDSGLRTRPVRLLQALPLLLVLSVPVSSQAPAAPPAEPIVSQTSPQFVHRLDSALKELEKNGWFSGAVLVSHLGKPLYARAYGMADVARKIPNSIETRFNIGSMNKMMTAVAIMQLAEARKISLGARVGVYLPDYPNGEVRDKVTLSQLLTHTSGLGSYWNERFNRDRLKIETVNDYLSLFADDPLLFAPGERFEYSNDGFIVLGAIVERVSGMTYFDYVGERILRPAGMVATDFSALRDSVTSRAVGYMSPDGDDGPTPMPDVSKPAPVTSPNWQTLPNRGGPAGGGYTTAGDLVRFGDALSAGKLVSQQWLDSLWTARVPMSEMPTAASYGYGFMVRQSPLGRQVGHTGGSPGVASSYDLYIDKGYGVAVLTNQDPVGLRLALRKISAGLRGLELSTERK